MGKLVVGISYATEQQEEVRAFVEELKKLDISYFYDEEHPHLFWGEYKPEVLSKIYKQVNCVVAFVSSEYLQKCLPNYEMLISFYSQMHDINGIYRFMPILYKNVKMPDFYYGHFYLNRDKYDIKQIARIVDDKLKLLQKMSQKGKSLKSLLKLCLKNNKSTCTYFDTSHSNNFGIKKGNGEVLYNFTFNDERKEYFVYSDLNKLKAIIKIEQNTIKITNYGLFAGIETELTIEQFVELLGQNIRLYG